MTKRHFDLDWSQFLDMAENGERVWAHKSSSQKETSQAWNGTATFSDAVDLARFGWQEGREKLTEGLRIASAVNHESFAPARWFDVAGERPDISRFCAGDPEYMINQGESLVSKKPVLRLLVQVGGNVATSQAQFNNYGGAIVSWVDALESEGYRVELSFCIQTNSTNARNSRDQLSAIVKVKDASEPVEIDRLAFAFAHPSLFRRLWFAIMEQQVDLESSLSGCYGYQQRIRDDLAEGFIYIDGISNDAGEMREKIKTVDGAVKAIGDLVKEAIGA